MGKIKVTQILRQAKGKFSFGELKEAGRAMRGLASKDPAEKTEWEAKWLIATHKMADGRGIRRKFIKNLEKQIAKNLKKGKIQYLCSEYRRYINCDKLMNFLHNDLGISREAFDSMFPKEVVDSENKNNN